MNDLLEIVARSSGSTLPSLGNILFVSETGSTTQNRADGLGRIDKPFKLQRAFDVAQPNDIIIIYEAIPFTNYSVNISKLHIFIYTDHPIIFNFNNTSSHEIYCYVRGITTFSFMNITNIQNSRINIYTANLLFNLSNCINSVIYCQQYCDITISSSLNNCTFKSNVRSIFRLNSNYNFSGLNIDNFVITSGAYHVKPTFTNCTFNKCIFNILFSNLIVGVSNITNCFFYDSRLSMRYSGPSTAQINISNNKFVRNLIDFTNLNINCTIIGNSTTNKFIDCVLFRSNVRSVRIENTTWILKDCIIHNPNSSISSSGFFNVTGTCNLYLIDCKYELPPSSPYAISNDYTGELQLINCQLPTNITGGKTPTITSNVFIGDLPNINDVLDNI